MPQVRYFTVDVHVQAKVSGVSDSGGELTHGDAAAQILSLLRSTPALVHDIEIGSVTVTETLITGRPVAAPVTGKED